MKRELYVAGQEMVQDAPQLFVDLDVEADGVPGYGSLLSVGAVTPWGDNFYRELRPSSDEWLVANHDFCEEHGLERERLLREGVEPAEAMFDLMQWTREHKEKYQKTGSVLVAFNASFDFPWIDLEMKRAGITNPYGIAGYCIKSLAQVISPNYDWKQTGKNHLPPEVVPEGDFTHNALEDAIWQQKLHFALLGYITQE